MNLLIYCGAEVWLTIMQSERKPGVWSNSTMTQMLSASAMDYHAFSACSISDALTRLYHASQVRLEPLQTPHRKALCMMTHMMIYFSS